MAPYESDLTRFMRRYLQEHPEEIASQAEGRAAWWDKRADARDAPASARQTPRAGGAEHTFKPLSESEGE